MNKNIRTHVENLFKDAPQTKRAYDLKEELICNLTDKYKDLINEGKNEHEAYDSVISGIGNIDELLNSLENNSTEFYQMQLDSRKKTALIVSICIGLYIFSFISVIILSELHLPDFIYASSFFALTGISTCILVYHFMSRPKYIKADDSIVENFKEWQSSKSKDKEIKALINSTLWSIIIGIYFIISFLFAAWTYSWIIFIIGSAISSVVELCFKLKN